MRVVVSLTGEGEDAIALRRALIEAVYRELPLGHDPRPTPWGELTGDGTTIAWGVSSSAESPSPRERARGEA